MSYPVSRTRTVQLATLVKGALLLGVAAAGIAHADPSPALDRVSISAGAFFSKPKIQAAGDTQYGYVETPETSDGHTTLPRVKAEFLLGDSQGFSLDYFRYDKDYNPTIGGATTYEGRPVSGTVAAQGKLKLDMAQLAYRWWLGQGNDVFGIGIGGAYLHAKLSGSATGQLTGSALTAIGAPETINFSGSGSASESGYAPLLEFAYKHAFTPDLRLYAEASGIKKNGGNLDGHVYGGAVGVEWFATRNVGVVFDYGIQKIKLSRNGERTADLDVKLTGPSAFVKVRF
jgi:hypothetical protein